MEAQAPVDCEKQYSNQRDGNAVRPRKSCSPRESGVPLIDIHWSSMVAEVRRWVCRCQEWLPHACRACARLPAASSVIGIVQMKLSSGVSSVFVSSIAPARVLCIKCTSLPDANSLVTSIFELRSSLWLKGLFVRFTFPKCQNAFSKRPLLSGGVSLGPYNLYTWLNDINSSIQMDTITTAQAVTHDIHGI